MIRAAKFSGFIGLGLIMALSLGGCSSAPQGDSYVPPGLELGETVVAPPKELPAPAAQPENPADVTVDVSCEAPQQLSREIIARLNAPETTVERKDPSLDGDFILSASEIPIESSYQKVFSYLVKATMASGKTVWLGSSGSLTDPEVLEKVILNPEGASSIFGATPEAYETLVWGAKAGPQGALVQESTKVVELYGGCF